MQTSIPAIVSKYSLKSRSTCRITIFFNFGGMSIEPLPTRWSLNGGSWRCGSGVYEGSLPSGRYPQDPGLSKTQRGSQRRTHWIEGTHPEDFGSGRQIYHHMPDAQD